MYKILILAVMLAGVGFYWASKNKTEQLLSTQNLSAGDTNTGNLKNLGHYLKSSRAGTAEKLKAQNKTPEACIDFFDELQRIDFKAEKKLTSKLLPPKPQNCTLDDPKLLNALKLLDDECYKKIESEFSSEECGPRLIFARSAITRWILDDKPLSEISDMSQLTDLLFAEFSDLFGNKNEPNFARMGEVSKRMLEIEPGLYGAAKVGQMVSVLEALIRKDKMNPSELELLWQKAEQDLIRLKQMRPEDKSLRDTEIAVKTRGFDPKLVLSYSEQLIHDHPEDSEGFALMAYAEWKLGSRPSSIEHLKKAILMSPDNKDYGETLKAITAPGATEESFKGMFRFGISNDEFGV